ncbi:hypothetical protein [Actinobaculum massiliense]|uniref:hypothetical protein n=1 Tax=Actinobaculum massiliense TaxID=202789 RepID=UPI00071AF4A6|nr:hypothetical protein [Actinobaculum massiliense]
MIVVFKEKTQIVDVDSDVLRMDVPVVAPVQADCVGDIGGSGAIMPLLGMVDVAGLVGVGAAGEYESAVARDHGILLRL